jgi:metacaspase-1
MATKWALCVGINDYPIPNADLKGCVNDAKGWADVLKNLFGFPESNITMLLDSNAKKAKIIAGLKDLLAKAKAGDILVFSNSSHGSYRADTSSDEPMYDEIICPYDIRDNEILDDDLYELFQNLPDDVHLTVILDNCHSGSGTRDVGDDHRTERFLKPEDWNQRSIPNFRLAKPKRSKKGDRPESAMKEVLLAGCRDIEVSWDALIGGKFHGAMSHSALTAIREANGQLTYAQLHQEVLKKIKAGKFNQTPQLEGNDANKKRLIFT